MDVMCWLHICLLIAHSYKNFTHNEKLYRSNLEFGLIECHHDSANFKQVWLALTALASVSTSLAQRSQLYKV